MQSPCNLELYFLCFIYFCCPQIKTLGCLSIIHQSAPEDKVASTAVTNDKNKNI